MAGPRLPPLFFVRQQARIIRSAEKAVLIERISATYEKLVNDPDADDATWQQFLADQEMLDMLEDVNELKH